MTNCHLRPFHKRKKKWKKNFNFPYKNIERGLMKLWYVTDKCKLSSETKMLLITEIEMCLTISHLKIGIWITLRSHLEKKCKKRKQQNPVTFRKTNTLKVIHELFYNVCDIFHSDLFRIERIAWNFCRSVFYTINCVQIKRTKYFICFSCESSLFRFCVNLLLFCSYIEASNNIY